MQKVFWIIIVCAIIGFGCGSQKSEKTENKVITIATLKGPSAMSMVWMIDSLNQVQNKIEYQFIIKDEPMQVRKMMLDKTADFTVLPTTMAAILYNKGAEYQLAAIPCWNLIFVRSDSNIKNWNDLKGKRIHLMAKGMTPDVMFRYLLKKNNIDPVKDVKLDYSFPTHIDLANAVAANRTDLAVISEPLLSMVMYKNKSIDPVFGLNDEWNKAHKDTLAIAFTSLLVSKDMANNNKAIVNEFLDYYEKSVRWINKNHEQGAYLIKKYGILPNSDVAKSSIPRSNLEFRRAYDIRGKIAAYLEIFYTLDPKIVGGKMPDEDFYFKN